MVSQGKIGSIVLLGRGHFPYNPRHFVPGYYRAVPPGQKTLVPFPDKEGVG